MGNEQELRPLPCPFCGGDAETAKSPLQLGLWRVGCQIMTCLGRMPMQTTWGWTTEAEAIAAWNRRSPDEQAEVVGWPIDTEDQVEALAKECGWNNRRYMTPKDYAIWCGQMRQFAKLSSCGVTDLRAAAQAVIDQWDTPNWKLDAPTADIINRLRAALAVGDEGIREGGDGN